MAKARGKKSKVSRSKSKVTRKSVKKPAKKLKNKKRYMRQAPAFAVITKEQQKSINDFIKVQDLTKISTGPQGTLVKMDRNMFDLPKVASEAGLTAVKRDILSYYIKPQEAKPVAAQAVESKPFVSASPQSEPLRREFTDPAAAAPVERSAAAQRTVSIAFVRNEDIATLKNPPKNLDLPHNLLKEGTRLNELDLSSYDSQNHPDLLKQAGIAQETLNEIARAIGEGRSRVLLIDEKNRPKQ